MCPSRRVCARGTILWSFVHVYPSHRICARMSILWGLCVCIHLVGLCMYDHPVGFVRVYRYPSVGFVHIYLSHGVCMCVSYCSLHVGLCVCSSLFTPCAAYACVQ